jgi:hypothetical protein
MDDILIGVGSVEEGERCIARLQLRLEALGLYPNASKTMVVPVKVHLAEAMVDANAEIERLTSELEKYSSTGVPHVVQAPHGLLSSISELSRYYRDLKVRPRRWGRVIRRIYTLQRRAGLDDWWTFWREDVERDPGSAAAIFEFVRSKPLTEQTAADLVFLSRKYCHP